MTTEAEHQWKEDLPEEDQVQEELLPRPGEPRRPVEFTLPADFHLVGLEEVRRAEGVRWACYLKVMKSTGALRRGEGTTVQEAIDAAEAALRLTLARSESAREGQSMIPRERSSTAGMTDEERKLARRARRAARKAKQAAEGAV